MSGIYYALSIIGMLVIVGWFVKNDKRTNATGLLAIKPPSGKGSKKHS